MARRFDLSGKNGAERRVAAAALEIERVLAERRALRMGRVLPVALSRIYGAEEG